MDSIINNKQSNQRIVRHPEYYIHGGDIIFRVEDTFFRVHRYFFTRDSAFFRRKLPHPPPPGEFTKGSSDNYPLVLEDALQIDFERFLWVFYNPKYSLYDANVEEWTSILKLAHQWEFVGVKTLALRELERLEIPPLRKIVIYHSYGIDRRLLKAAYTAFATRDKPITIEEGKELGLETVLQLARARELARAPATSGTTRARAPSPVTVAGSELDELIRDIFELSPPDEDSGRNVALSKPTAGGNMDDRAGNKSGAQPNGASPHDPNSVKSTGGAPNSAANGHANPAPDAAANVQVPKNQANNNRVNGK